MAQANKPVNNIAPHSQQFYLGLVVGGLVGAGITYLAKHKNGGEVKKELLLQAKKLARYLPDFIDELSSQAEEQASSIKKELNQLKTILEIDPDAIEAEIEKEQKEASSASHKVIDSVKSTASRAQRFFSKAGKLLR